MTRIKSSAGGVINMHNASVLGLTKTGRGLTKTGRLFVFWTPALFLLLSGLPGTTEE
ncbi:MAG: hypothetical protein SGJ21_05335 [Alphaproteobacteria bacterium]|nr:hypothetical protein [Alphaproteobacteria bacterium]